MISEPYNFVTHGACYEEAKTSYAMKEKMLTTFSESFTNFLDENKAWDWFTGSLYRVVICKDHFEFIPFGASPALKSKEGMTPEIMKTLKQHYTKVSIFKGARSLTYGDLDSVKLIKVLSIIATILCAVAMFMNLNGNFISLCFMGVANLLFLLEWDRCNTVIKEIETNAKAKYEKAKKEGITYLFKFDFDDLYYEKENSSSN